jgi:hypothetical protein
LRQLLCLLLVVLYQRFQCGAEARGLADVVCVPLVSVLYTPLLLVTPLRLLPQLFCRTLTLILDTLVVAAFDQVVELAVNLLPLRDVAAYGPARLGYVHALPSSGLAAKCCEETSALAMSSRDGTSSV